MKYESLVGKKFGRLTVLEEFKKPEEKYTYFVRCKCDCGNEFVTRKNAVKRCLTLSCGCLHKERTVQAIKTHGGCKTRLYQCWSHMLRRCKENAKGKDRKNYYERGIRVCDEWHSFENFRDWALANGYRDDLTIDRIDNNGNYCPENCRWADAYTQANNKRNIRYITYKGETDSVANMARKYGLTKIALYKRIFLRGWDVERAIETPLMTQFSRG